MTTAIRRAAEGDADAEYEPLIDRGLVHVIGDPIEGENLGLYARLGYEETDRAGQGEVRCRLP
ncbi:MAG: hypothetical protein AUG48_04685 [Actinobacteria bacterium 13_1_20CM_3_68_9]|nr:MAG: hypothetical protein AUG48_04685 [Actinobacteria bacterium 13_1_20CM_3_68_9]